ncbi:response regulator transcription factor [Pararhizobium arenae]|uniref:response regulator transcription factor n=1 Tax=Pararhizobium arenae TaxID=1856850 RepID=UPI00094AFCCF|nr:response regulator [Pararhizobium arenae]
MVTSNEWVAAVVDDDDSLRESLRDLLESAGVASKLYSSADAFLLSEGYLGTDLIFSDFEMPGLSGIDLLRQLQGLSDVPPIILMTSHTDPHVVSKALSYGAVAVLSKPIDTCELLKSLEHLLNRDERADETKPR